MDQDDPRRQLDPFTAALVEQLRAEIEMMAKQLVSLQHHVALAQLDVLRQRAFDRLGDWELGFQSDLARLGGSPLSEEDVLKVIGVTSVALAETFERVRKHVIDCADAIYGDPDEPDLPE